jgi:oxalate decarboxylase/phosphoglucose isomerase-like protein (cupin superfamily)
MNTRSLLLASAATIALASVASAQDVMTVAKDHYRVLVDNPQVRVVENTLLPGQKDALHTHQAGWYYITKPGTMKVVFADGRTELWTPKAGESGWSPAEGAHTSENIGNAPMSYVLVEIKSAEPQSARSARASTAAKSDR